MATSYRRKNSPYYWISYRKADGNWGDRSTGIRIDQEGSKRKIQQRISEETAKEELMRDDGGSALLRAWVPGWIDYHYTNINSRKRGHNAWAHLSQFIEIKKILHPQEITYAFCHEFMRWRTDAEACKREARRCGNWNTALTEVRILGAILQEAVARGWVIANPCARLRLGRKDTKEKLPFEPEDVAEIEGMLKGADQWMQDAWLVGIKQGCRLSEVQVPMSRITEKTGNIVFKVKGGGTHNAPLHRDLLHLVARRRKEKAEMLVELPDNASKKFNQWLTNRGYPDHSFHCLRVTVITRFALANVTLEKAMQYVGHCSEMAHAIYRKLKPKDVAGLGDHL